jgi:hypothetical protein
MSRQKRKHKRNKQNRTSADGSYSNRAQVPHLGREELIRNQDDHEGKNRCSDSISEVKDSLDYVVFALFT